MKIGYAAKTEWEAMEGGHRGVGLKIKTLLTADSFIPGGYHLSIAETPNTYRSPRHKHNFDQIRISLKGSTNYGPNLEIGEGEVVYFPEGVPYGPQDQGPSGVNLGVVVQFGGATGYGAFPPRENIRAMPELLAKGVFSGGRYRPYTPPGGEQSEIDGFQAVWQHVMGTEVEYPAPRYLEPVHMLPANFPWTQRSKISAAFEKHMGTFSERSIILREIWLEPGVRYELASREGLQLVFFYRGDGVLDGNVSWEAHSAVEIAAGESALLNAASTTHALIIGFALFGLPYADPRITDHVTERTL
ncbi:MAG: hypothetical protein ACREU6_13740 [Steroidobacteraceae bacterium]